MKLSRMTVENYWFKSLEPRPITWIRYKSLQAKKCGNAVLIILVPLSYAPSLPLFKIWLDLL